MKPICAAIKAGCLCVGLLVGFGANADWQFSRHNNDAGQMTCSAILNQGHTFDTSMTPPTRLDLPRGTLELFTDKITQQVRMNNGQPAKKPVIAFHWLYPTDATRSEDIEDQRKHYLWDPRSVAPTPTIQTALTRRWGISYRVMDASGNDLMNESFAPGSSMSAGPWVERLGDVVPATSGSGLQFTPIADSVRGDYVAGGSAPNSSFWWDIPDTTLNYLTGMMPVTLRVEFYGHSGFTSNDRHPIVVSWDISGGDRAMTFLNRAMCTFP